MWLTFVLGVAFQRGIGHDGNEFAAPTESPRGQALSESALDGDGSDSTVGHESRSSNDSAEDIVYHLASASDWMEPEFPTLGLTGNDFVFDGGSSGTWEGGRILELQWRVDDLFAQIYVRTTTLSQARASIAGWLVDDPLVSYREIRGHPAVVLRDAESTTVALWLEGGALVELRLSGDASDLDQLIQTIVDLDDETIAREFGVYPTSVD